MQAGKIPLKMQSQILWVNEFMLVKHTAWFDRLQVGIKSRDLVHAVSFCFYVSISFAIVVVT